MAADPLFTAAYRGVSGALVIACADDPGMVSSQNEQDNRRYVAAAGVPMLEPSDSQEAYDLCALAVEISERWHTPVILRMTTRICHSKTVVRPREFPQPPSPPHFERDVAGRVMIPAYARSAHRRLRAKLAEDEARRVVSVIGDSTFVHSGITGMVEMVYNPPPTGHVILLLDNATTAMTGLQEHPGTGRKLNHEPTTPLSFEDLARSVGVKNVDVIDPGNDEAAFESLLQKRLASSDLSVIIVRRPCILAIKKIRQYERAREGTA